MELQFTLSVEETNLILGALSQFPYHQVAALIKNIEAQTLEQMTPKQSHKFPDAGVVPLGAKVVDDVGA